MILGSKIQRPLLSRKTKNGSWNGIKLLLSNFPEAHCEDADIYASRFLPLKIASIATNATDKVTVNHRLKIFFQKQDFAHWLLLHSKKEVDPNV